MLNKKLIIAVSFCAIMTGSIGGFARAETEQFLDSDKDTVDFRPTFDETGQEPVKATDVMESPLPPGGKGSGGAGCFDFYKFGSVDMPFQGESEQVQAGESINFRGKVRNNNDYPVVDGMVYAKVYHKIDPTNLAKKELVDEFVAAKNVNILGQSEVPLEFLWKAPKASVGGDYLIALDFITSQKYNLTGLSFTQDVSGNSFGFSVVSESKSGVMFPNDFVTVNGESYAFNAFIPKVGQSDSIEVKARLVNNLPSQESVDITWKLYRWDAIDPANLLKETNETEQLELGASKDLLYRIDDTSKNVYFLVGEAKWRDAKAILEVRIGRENRDMLRINYPSVTAYPLKKGEKTTLFSCLHNAGTNDIVKDGKLTLTLKDTKGKIIHETVYNGNVTGSMMAHKDEFVPGADYDVFTLVAELSQGGKKLTARSSSMIAHCSVPMSAVKGHLLKIIPWWHESPFKTDGFSLS